MKTALYIRSIFLLLLVLCGVGVATAQTTAKQSADEPALTALIKKAVDAQASFDAASLEALYASDYVEISPVGEYDPREKAIGFYKTQPNSAGGPPKMSVLADEFNVRSYGKVAVVIARVTFSPAGNAAQQRPPISFRATYVCRKEKGAWKISSVQVTGIRPTQPPK